MKNLMTLIIPIFLCGLLNGQTPILVSDFSDGAESTFTNLYRGANGNDFAILNGSTPENGTEPIILKDGQLTLLDIMEGTEGSWPGSYLAHDGFVYFETDYLEDAAVVWRTDGTEAGTIKIFESENSGTNYISGIIEAASGELYFTNVDDLYRIVDDGAEFVASNVMFESNSQKGNTYTKYKSHFAFLRKSSELELVEYDGTDFNVLGTVPAGFIATFHGLGEVDGGLVFHVVDFSDEEVEGIYSYSEQEGMITKKDLDLQDLEPRRSFNLNGESQVYYFYNDGWVTMDANDNGIKETLQTGGEYWLQEYDFQVNGDKFIYVSSSPFGADPTLGISDGTAVGTSMLMTAEASYFSNNFLVHDDLIIFGDGISNGFDANIYVVNTVTGVWEKMYQFSGNVINGQGFTPVLVEGNRLYFSAESDFEIGQEMYYIESAILDPTSVEDGSKLTELDVEYYNQSLMVKSEATSSLVVEIYTIDGRLIQSLNGNTNELLHFDTVEKTLLFRFLMEDGAYSEIKTFE